MAKTKFQGEKLTTPTFRLSFPNLFEARAVGDDPNAVPKFSCSAIWAPEKFTPKEKDQWRALLKELDRAAREEFDSPWKELPDNVKRGLRDGASKADKAGYGKGTKFASLTSKNRPGVCDVNKADISPEDGNADDVYPGCWCRATVQVYTYNNKGKGIAIGLRNIQKVRDDKRLDNRVAAKDDFDEELEAAVLDQADDDYGKDEDFE